jgi:hypothetical protein
MRTTPLGAQEVARRECEHKEIRVPRAERPPRIQEGNDEGDRKNEEGRHSPSPWIIAARC